MAVSRFEISSWHNSLAIMTSTDTFLIGKTVVSTEQLQNKTVANMKLRPFLEKELLLEAFNIYGNTLQCLSAESFLLNGKVLTCRPFETFVLPLEYEVQLNGKRLVHHIMVRRGQMLNNEWLDQFDFPRPQENFKVGVNHVHAIHPVLDEFLFTEAGNISVASVSLVSGGTVLLVVVGCLICCCCCPSFRQCSFAACTRISSSIYNGCTTEAYRLQKENRRLRERTKSLGKLWKRVWRSIV